MAKNLEGKSRTPWELKQALKAAAEKGDAEGALEWLLRNEFEATESLRRRLGLGSVSFEVWRQAKLRQGY